MGEGREAHRRKTVTTPPPLVINEAEAEMVWPISRCCVEERMSSSAMQRPHGPGYPAAAVDPAGMGTKECHGDPQP
jgi:hypothetical protein